MKIKRVVQINFLTRFVSQRMRLENVYKEFMKVSFFNIIFFKTLAQFFKTRHPTFKNYNHASIRPDHLTAKKVLYLFSPQVFLNNFERKTKLRVI